MNLKQSSSVSRFLGDLSHLIYPNLCLACERELSKSESYICALCNSNLYLTNFHLSDLPSDMDKLFWGRTKIENTYAHFHFEKNKVSQHILFSLKYKNNAELGVYFGREIGKRLSNTSTFNPIDAYIPVPLHPKKQFIRGYNQSEAIAKGICQELNTKLDVDTVKRVKHSETQTKKSRFQRWDNVTDIFSISKTIVDYQHIVLVDDVITTGSTIESLIISLRKKNPDLLISVVTLAIA